MFDIGFSELVVIAVVALIVIGPERLPRVARTLGLLFRRAQRYVNDIKVDIARQVELEELKQVRGEATKALHAVEQAVTREISAVGASTESVSPEVVQSGSAVAATDTRPQG